jgi:hypothetical protein
MKALSCVGKSIPCKLKWVDFFAENEEKRGYKSAKTDFYHDRIA